MWGRRVREVAAVKVDEEQGKRGRGRLAPRRWQRMLGESQNHRIVGVGRDLCGSSSPASCRSRVTYSRL